MPHAIHYIQHYLPYNAQLLHADDDDEDSEDDLQKNLHILAKKKFAIKLIFSSTQDCNFFANFPNNDVVRS